MGRIAHDGHVSLSMFLQEQERQVCTLDETVLEAILATIPSNL